MGSHPSQGLSSDGNTNAAVPYGYNFDLLDVAFFLFTALLVIWVWWGVPKWQVAVTFIRFDWLRGWDFWSVVC